MSTEELTRRTALYVDGFNLYHAIDALNNPKLKWLNLAVLARNMLRPGESLAKVQFFTTVLDWDLGKKERHQAYVTALEARGVIVSHGKFKRAPKHCSWNNTTCTFREEKQTDVAIAVAMVSDAYDDVFDRAILLTADTDQIPCIRQIQARFPTKQLTWLAPPGRMQQAREIGDLIPDRSELSVGQLTQCRLPHNIKDAAGNLLVTVPPEYL